MEFQEQLEAVKQGLLLDPDNQELRVLLKEITELIELSNQVASSSSSSSASSSASHAQGKQEEQEEEQEEDEEEEEYEEEEASEEDIFADPDKPKVKKVKRKRAEASQRGGSKGLKQQRVQEDDDNEEEEHPEMRDPGEGMQVDVEGVEVPAQFTSFSALHPTLQTNVKRAGFNKPTNIQSHTLPILMSGRDLMATAQTGSGKTAAYLLPIIHRFITSAPPKRPLSYTKVFPWYVILSPTRELASQIYAQAEKFIVGTGISAAVIYGGADYGEQAEQITIGCDILSATPGRLLDMLKRGKISLSQVQCVCLDEADRMLDMGFEKDIRNILNQYDLPGTGKRITAMLSATFPKPIQQLATEFLHNYIFLRVGRTGSTTESITQVVKYYEEIDKRRGLFQELKERPTGKTLVFVRTKKSAESLSSFLLERGVQAEAIHGDRSQREREESLSLFKSNQVNVLVATDVAARGLDIPQVALVINYDLPAHIDDYVHRIGRTGRQGQKGHATAFYNATNKNIAKPLTELLEESGQDVPAWLSLIVKKEEESKEEPEK